MAVKTGLSETGQSAPPEPAAQPLERARPLLVPASRPAPPPVVIPADRASIVQYIRDQRAAGTSFRKISLRLIERKVPPLNGVCGSSPQDISGCSVLDRKTGWSCG